MLQFDVCCKDIDQNFDCGCDRCAILRLDSLLVVLSPLAVQHQPCKVCASGSCSEEETTNIGPVFLFNLNAS